MSKKETKQEMSKYCVYTSKIYSHLLQMFLNEECENHINVQEMNEDDNFTHFIYALANAVPCIFVQKFSKNMGVENNLDMNHLANKLCFEFMTKEG